KPKGFAQDSRITLPRARGASGETKRVNRGKFAAAEWEGFGCAGLRYAGAPGGADRERAERGPAATNSERNRTWSAASAFPVSVRSFFLWRRIYRAGRDACRRTF